jgi:PrtD family type I secretion system ABC transporter
VAVGKQSVVWPIVRNHSSVLWTMAAFSLVINLLMLTGPLFMMQVYDRVLVSRSGPTLVALFAIVSFLFLGLGLLDYSRAIIGQKFAAKVQIHLSKSVLDPVSQNLNFTQRLNALGQLDTIHRVLGSQTLIAVFDLPWTPIFLLIIAVMDPMLGIFCLGCCVLLILLSALHRHSIKPASRESVVAKQQADAAASLLTSNDDLSIGAENAILDRLHRLRSQSFQSDMRMSDISIKFASTTRIFRIYLQSAVLAFGAMLFLQDNLTPGAIVAASVLLGRALAPIEVLLAQWPSIISAGQAIKALDILLGLSTASSLRSERPRPVSHLQVTGLGLSQASADQTLWHNLNFELDPGQALGICGANGSGKSTLARILAGQILAPVGTVQLGGFDYQHYDKPTLGALIGYLGQSAPLLSGTIAENIAQMALLPDMAKVVKAAKTAQIHDAITALPDCYQTLLGSDFALSAGQRQRVALARSLYGDPVLLILDEPQVHLDYTGIKSLRKTIQAAKSSGMAVIVLAHQSPVFQDCDSLLILKDRGKHIFGPQKLVLAELAQANSSSPHVSPSIGSN